MLYKTDTRKPSIWDWNIEIQYVLHKGSCLFCEFVHNENYGHQMTRNFSDWERLFHISNKNLTGNWQFFVSSGWHTMWFFFLPEFCGFRNSTKMKYSENINYSFFWRKNGQVCNRLSKMHIGISAHIWRYEEIFKGEATKVYVHISKIKKSWLQKWNERTV